MAQVTVFVDDAVLGRLPGVCAKDGVATDDRLTIRTPVGDGARLGALWLLVFAGPIGWVVLLFLATSRSGQAERVTVEVPMSAAAYQRVLDARARVRNATVVACGGIAVVVAGAAAGGTVAGPIALCGAALLVGGFATMLVGDRRQRQASVLVDLDGSRRWVTLQQVHPAFVAACEAHRHRTHTANPP